MDVAALITWLATAVGGFVLLGTWISKGGVRQAQTGQSRFPPAVIFGHFLLAAVGLVLWIVFLASDESSGLAWTSLVILLVVALLGFAMLARWLGGRRAGAAAGREPPLMVIPPSRPSSGSRCRSSWSTACSGQPRWSWC